MRQRKRGAAPRKSERSRALSRRSERRPTGRDDVRAAILEAALRLFGERSPSRVSLREVAREAGVNYGLVHRHFGTKDALMAAVFRSLSDYGAQLAARAPDIYTALATLRGHQASRRFSHLLAGALLDGADPGDLLGESEAFRVLVELLGRVEERGASREPGTAQFDPRLVTAAAVLLSIGWDLFGPFLVEAAALTDRTGADVRRELGRLIDAIVRHTRAGGLAS